MYISNTLDEKTCDQNSESVETDFNTNLDSGVITSTP